MNQSEVSAHDPIIVDAVPIALIEGAARDLKDFNEEILAPGALVELSRNPVRPGPLHGLLAPDHGVAAWQGAVPWRRPAGGPMIAAIYARNHRPGVAEGNGE